MQSLDLTESLPLRLLRYACWHDNDPSFARLSEGPITIGFAGVPTYGITFTAEITVELDDAAGLLDHSHGTEDVSSLLDDVFCQPPSVRIDITPPAYPPRSQVLKGESPAVFGEP